MERILTDTNVEQKINLKGEQHNFGIAGRDIINQHYKPEFFTPYLDNYQDTQFTSPIITPKLVELVMREHFLILAGNGCYKPGLARHIAWKVLNINSGNSIEIKEWAGSTNPQDLKVYFEKEKKPTMFILPNISPQNINYNLQELFDSALKEDHYVIISTNSTTAQWKLDANIKRLWWQPDPNQNLYDLQVLTELLIHKLDDVEKSLPEKLKNKDFMNQKTLIGNLKLEDVANALKTPESIDMFVRLLIAMGEQKSLDETSINEIIENCSSDKRALEQWFYHSLSPREQLIAIGLCLFEGMDDNQFFAAMDILIGKSWHTREPTLQSLDYCDLDALRNYFNLNPMSRDGYKKVESQIPGQRRKLLETVWNSHRRQIYKALPILETFLIDSESITANLLNSELFGTKSRCHSLRETISETLCIIGLKPEDSINGSIIEDTLFKLAAQEDHAVQAVAAQTMSRWRYYGQHDKLFSTLRNWQDNKTWEILKLLIKDQETERKESPDVYIKSTIALTVGFAALYDLPNHMHPKLCELFEKLAEDAKNIFIRIRFAEYTLPLLVRVHTTQLRDILYKMACKPYLALPIGASLASAIQGGVVEAMNILNSWLEMCERERQPHYSPGKTTQRESVMAAVAFAFGSLQIEDKDNDSLLISSKIGFQRLKDILNNENSPFVRKVVVYAMTKQIESSIEDVQKHLQPLFSSMHEKEREIIADKLVEIHLEQRANLESGDSYFQWSEEFFPIWLHKKHPLTPVETVMKGWLKQVNIKEVAQIALEFEVSQNLTTFEEKEEQVVLEEKEEYENSLLQHDADKFSTKPSFTIVADDLVNRLISWLVGFPHKKNQKKIRWLLPIILKKKSLEPEKMIFLFKKFEKYSDKEINIITGKLKWAQWLVKNNWVLLLIFIVGISLLMILL